LRDLPFAPRLVIAAFLLSVGIGYFSALVQLHFYRSKPGQLIPGAEETKKAYSLDQGRPVSHLERLLASHEGKFNGTGTMVPALFEKSEGWAGQLKRRKTAKEKDELRAEREGERQALLYWVRTGADRKAYDQNSLALPTELSQHAITPDYVDEAKKTVKLKDLLTERCVVCHSASAGKDDNAKNYPLETHKQIKEYTQAKASGGMSLKKLSQTTHVHLLGFAMLYGLTGLIFAFTSYPAAVRLVVGPLPLVVQVVDIACWWLARVDAVYAHLIPVTGAVVAMGLGVHIVGGLLDLFGRLGKAVVLAVLLAGCIGVSALYVEVIAPYLEQEVAAENGQP
jgi:hypothetical protein